MYLVVDAPTMVIQRSRRAVGVARIEMPSVKIAIRLDGTFQESCLSLYRSVTHSLLALLRDEEVPCFHSVDMQTVHLITWKKQNKRTRRLYHGNLMRQLRLHKKKHTRLRTLNLCVIVQSLFDALDLQRQRQRVVSAQRKVSAVKP